jgi:hypothetical protein
MDRAASKSARSRGSASARSASGARFTRPSSAPVKANRACSRRAFALTGRVDARRPMVHMTDLVRDDLVAACRSREHR